MVIDYVNLANVYPAPVILCGSIIPPNIKHFTFANVKAMKRYTQDIICNRQVTKSCSAGKLQPAREATLSRAYSNLEHFIVRCYAKVVFEVY